MKKGLFELGSDKGRGVYQEAKVKIGRSHSRSGREQGEKAGSALGNKEGCGEEKFCMAAHNLDSILWEMRSPQEFGKDGFCSRLRTTSVRLQQKTRI